MHISRMAFKCWHVQGGTHWIENVHSKHYMNDAKLGNTTEEKDLGVIVADNLMVALSIYSKGNRVLGMIKWTVVSRDIHILLNLYKTTVRPHLETCSPASRMHGLHITKKISCSYLKGCNRATHFPNG